MDGMMNVTELPFHELGENRLVRTRERLDGLYREALNFRGDGNVAWTVGRPFHFTEYSRLLSALQRTNLARYRRPDTFVVAFDLRSQDEDGDPFGMSGLFLIRVGHAGQARVLAIASEDHMPKPR